MGQVGWMDGWEGTTGSEGQIPRTFTARKTCADQPDTTQHSGRVPNNTLPYYSYHFRSMEYTMHGILMHFCTTFTKALFDVLVEYCRIHTAYYLAKQNAIMLHV